MIFQDIDGIKFKMGGTDTQLSDGFPGYGVIGSKSKDIQYSQLYIK